MNIVPRRRGPGNGAHVDLFQGEHVVGTVYHDGGVNLYHPAGGISLTLYAQKSTPLLLAMALDVTENPEHWPALLDALQDDPTHGERVRTILAAWEGVPCN